MINFKSVILIAVFLTSIFSAAPPGLQAEDKDDPELISLDIKGMDIKDVLKILSQKSGLNIIADRDVTGPVQLYVNDINAMDALDMLVSTNDLAYEREGGLITVMTDMKYERLHGKRFKKNTVTEIVKLKYINASDAARIVMEMKSEIGKIISDDQSNTLILIDNPDTIEKMKTAINEIDASLITEVFSLNYASSEKIKEKIEPLISKNVGSLKVDERTNKVYIKDTPKKIEDIKRIIEAFDEKTQQVMIDATIVQVSLSDKYSYGIDWADIAKMGDIRFTADTNISTGLTGVTPSTLKIATTGGNYTTIISLLKTFGKTNVLSKPRITVTNKQEAKILVGAKEAYVTSEVTTTDGGTYHTTDHVNFVDVGISLLVTPDINRDGYITMKVKPEVSSSDATKTVELKNPDGSTRTIVPYVSTSQTETTVLVKDNTTLIIGGLMKDTITDHTEKVPFLGDMPMIGGLFSTKGKTKEKTELIVFITPRIIESDEMSEDSETYLEDKETEMEESAAEKETPIFKKEHVSSKWTPILGARPQDTDVTGIEPKEYPEEEYYENKKAPAKETAYEAYYSTLSEEINNMARVQDDAPGIEGDVELQFTLDKDGFLIRGPIVLNNPDLKLVRSAVNCVKNASPFAPFPRSLRKDRLEFNVVVRYE